MKYGNMALEAARHAGNLSAIALCQHALGWLSWKQGQYLEAQKLLLAVPQLHLDAGDTEWADWAKINLAKAIIAQGDLEYARQVVSNLSSDNPAVAHGLFTVRGRLAFEFGDFDAAKSFLLRALEITQSRGYRTSLGGRYVDLGNVALAQNQINEAEYYFKEGLRLGQEYYRRDKIARASYGLARVLACRGILTEAVTLANTARDQFVRMGMEKEVNDIDAFLERLRHCSSS